MPQPSFLSAIDWQQPWLASLRQRALALVEAIHASVAAPTEATIGNAMRAALNAAARTQDLRTETGLPLQFVPQEALLTGMAYEAFIAAEGCVPTRDNLHDFFNALVWLHFPSIKARLNALQAAAILQAEEQLPQAGTQRRGPLRDAATLFDENAALLVVADTELLDALRQHRWQEAFVQRRSAFGTHCEIQLFGHALMEKLVDPYKGITAHAWPMVVEGAFFLLPQADRQRIIDQHIRLQLTQALRPVDFTPLPVLGVPGWLPGQDAAFYADTRVFRPKRRGDVKTRI